MALSYASLDSIQQAKLALNEADKLISNSAGRTLVSTQLVKLGNVAFAKIKLRSPHVCIQLLLKLILPMRKHIITWAEFISSEKCSVSPGELAEST